VVSFLDHRYIGTLQESHETHYYAPTSVETGIITDERCLSVCLSHASTSLENRMEAITQLKLERAQNLKKDIIMSRSKVIQK